ncbi:MAG: molybdopterin-binding protein [Bacteroidota bacterium]
MRNIFLATTLLISISTFGQRKVDPTDTLRIYGNLKTGLTFTIVDLDTFRTKAVNDIIVTNNQGETKKTVKGLKGFLLKELLATADFQTEKPKELNEFYFIFIASDNYKVVFSWNEIFNTETGNNLYVITEKEGKRIKEMDERILIITSTDFKTGRRYIKGLEKIIVKRID